MAIQAHRAPTQHSVKAGDPPTVRHALALGPTDPARHHLVLLRPSPAIKIHVGSWYLEEGDELEGTPMNHPSNSSRKVIIRTTSGTFNVNQEDVADIPAANLP